MEANIISSAIRTARQQSGMTQKEVAQALNKAQTTVTAWELGRAQPDASTIVALSKLFEVSTDYLLGVSRASNKDFERAIDEIFGADDSAQTQENIKSVNALYGELNTALRMINQINPSYISDAHEIIYSAVSAVSALAESYVDTFYMQLGDDVLRKIKNFSPNGESTADDICEDFLLILRMAQLKDFASSANAIINNRKANTKTIEVLAEKMKNQMLETTLKEAEEINSSGAE